MAEHVPCLPFSQGTQQWLQMVGKYITAVATVRCGNGTIRFVKTLSHYAIWNWFCLQSAVLELVMLLQSHSMTTSIESEQPIYCGEINCSRDQKEVQCELSLSNGRFMDSLVRPLAYCTRKRAGHYTRQMGLFTEVTATNGCKYWQPKSVMPINCK